MQHLLRFGRNWCAALAFVVLGIFVFEYLGRGGTPERVTIDQKIVSAAPAVFADAGSPKLKLNVPKAASAEENKSSLPGIAAPAPASVPTHARTRGRVGNPRQMARKAKLSLLVPDVNRTLAALGALVRAVDGDIVKLDDERPATAGDRHAADATLIVPQDRFEATLQALAKLGGVRSQTIEAEDVGNAIVDDRARLENLRRTESDMRKIMDRSGKISEVLDVETQLTAVREQIETLDAETTALAVRVATSTIDVYIEGEAPVATARPAALSQLSDAWRFAWGVSGATALALVAKLFVVIAFAPYWLAVLAALAFVLRRRRLGGIGGGAA